MSFRFVKSSLNFSKLESPFTRGTYLRLRSQAPLHFRKNCLRATKTFQQPNYINTTRERGEEGASTVVFLAFLGGLHIGAMENWGPGNGALPGNCTSLCCWPFPFPPFGGKEGAPRILSLSTRGRLHRKHLCFVHPPRLQATQNHSVSTKPPTGVAPLRNLPCILTVCPGVE